MKSGKVFCLSGALFLALLLTGCAAPQREAALWGQADATEVDVNTKVPGRLVELYVREGQPVHKGDRLAQIDAREQDALTAAARARLEASLNLGETVVYAPFDGIVTTKYYDVGAMISTGMPLVAVQDPQDNWVDFKVKETELDKYTLNQQVKIVGRNSGLHLRGTVVDISKKPNFATYRATSERKDAEDIVTFNVKVQVNDSRVRPGMRFKLQQE